MDTDPHATPDRAANSAFAEILAEEFPTREDRAEFESEVGQITKDARRLANTNALRRAASGAWHFGNGFLMVTHHKDGTTKFEAIDPERVQVKP